MLIFGHAGITLGTAVLLNGTLAKIRTTKADQSSKQPQASSRMFASQNSSSGGIQSWFTYLADYFDIRFLLIGSLLPDIIDKPIGRFFFREVFNNGQIFGHTLLFLIIITAGGLLLYQRRNKTWLLALSFGTFMHLILDGMWLTPRTLLWPLYGLSFQRIYFRSWIQHLFSILLNEPLVSIPEIVGAGIIIWFAWLLLRRGKLYIFIRNGQV